MTKHYYEGKLIRTSKTHQYEYALLWRNKVIACCTNYANSLKRFSKEFNYAAGFTGVVYSSTYGNHSVEKAEELKLVKLTIEN